MGYKDIYKSWDSGIPQALKYSREILEHSGVHLDQEEFEGNALLVYWESLHSYPAYEGCCDWISYFEVQIRNLIQEMSRLRSQRICVESNLSLDQPCGKAQQPASEFLGIPQGDFTNGVAFWDYIARLGDSKLQLARWYCNKETDADILADTSMDCKDLMNLKCELQKDMEQYLAI